MLKRRTSNKDGRPGGPARPVTTGLAVLALAAFVAGCDGPQEREAKYMARAEQLFADDNFDRALLELKNVLQINPTNVKALYRLGQIAEKKADLRAAFGLFTKVVSQEPGHVGANLHLARFYLASGDVAEAQKRVDIVLNKQSGNAEARALQGAVYLRQGKADQALQEAQHALKLDPAELQATAVLVGVYRKQKQYNKALEAIEKGLEKHPGDRSLLLIRIALNVETDNRKAVERDFSELFKIAPKESAYRLMLARLYVLWKQPAAAELALRDAVRLKPKDDQLQKLLVSFLSEKRSVEEAEKSLRELIAQNPTSRIFQFGLADLYLQHDMAAKAKTVYQEIIEKSKDKAQVAVAKLALASLLYREGDAAQARKLVQAVWEQDPKRVEALLLLGRFDLRDKNYRAVVEKMREVLRQNPRSLEALGVLAEAYVRTQRLDLASDALGIAVSIQPKNERILLRQAQVFALQKRYGAAMETVDKILKERPTWPAALKLRSELLVATKRLDEAKGALDALMSTSADKSWIYHQLGQVHLSARKYEEAIEAFDKALAAGSKDGRVIVGITSALVALKRLDEAETRLKGYIEAQADDAYLRNLLGEVYVHQAKTELALQSFRKASELQPGWSLPYINRARLLLSDKKPDEAVDVLVSGWKRIPQSNLLGMTLAVLYQRQGRIDDAIKTYEQLLKQSPDVAPGANNLAALLADYRYEDKKELDRALALAKRFEDSQEAVYQDTLGWVHYRRGDYPLAISLLRRAVQGKPDNKEYRYHLGMAYFANGEADLARRELEAATAGNADYHGVEEAKKTLLRLIIEHNAQRDKAQREKVQPEKIE